MRRIFLTSSGLLLSAALLLGIAGVVVMLVERGRDAASLVPELERNMQADFSAWVQETSDASEEIANTYARRHSLGPSGEVVRLALDKDCQLIDWNDAELM